MRPYHLLLYPFSLLYDGITRLRNRMFDSGMKKSVAFEVPTVVVGNLSMGGTGKTPMVEFLIKGFKDHYAVATLSRGYGRKTNGYLLANETTEPEEIGDEPFQIFSKFGHEITVAVGEQRIAAIPQMIAARPDTELVILDDAFQHRYVKGDFNLLLTTFQRPFFNDHVVPMGMLRESRSGANRADAVVVTKCPDGLDEATKAHYRQSISAYAPENCPVFFAGLQYGRAYDVRNYQEASIEHVILLSGIANNDLLKKKVGEMFQLLETIEFSDHHDYTERDMEKIVARFKVHQAKAPVLLTTEKDAVKLKADKLLRYLQEIPIFALPIQVKMEEEEKNTLLEHVTKAIRNKGYQREV